VEIVLEELSAGLPERSQLIRMVVRLVVAMFLGAIIGFERERAGKIAGIRTHMLVSLGSALFVLIPMQTGASINDVTRVIQGVAAGVGFIGTGAIIKLKNDASDPDKTHDIQGLTTAAGIWLTAAVGVGAGMGRLGTSVFTILLALIILTIFTRLGDALENWQDRRESCKKAEPKKDT
jgi:putative Mg2+ transporter-C (MgtC) family protein